MELVDIEHWIINKPIKGVSFNMDKLKIEFKDGEWISFVADMEYDMPYLEIDNSEDERRREGARK